MFSVLFWSVILIVALKLNLSGFDRSTQFLINAVYYLPKEICENVKHISNNFKRDYGQKAENK